MNEDALSQLYLKDTAFQELMQCRIFNVLLVASPYDAFMMEEDGRVEEQLYFEYVALNLSSPPRVTRVSDFEAALTELHNKHYDLVVAMPGVDISTFFEGARGLKRSFPDTPIVILTPFRAKCRGVSSTRTCPASTTYFRGWAIWTCFWPSSSCWKTR